MRRMRSGLLLALAVALLAALPLSAQVAPTLTGETGLFGIQDADTVPQGKFALSLFYSMYDRTAASVPLLAPLGDDPLRYSTDKLGLSISFGLLPNWEASFTAGQRYYSSDDRLWAGNIGGRNRVGEVDHDETDKLRIGTKYVLNRKDPLKVALFAAAYIPTQRKSDDAAMSSYRTDWEWGFSGTYGIFSGQFSYLWTADYDPEYDPYEIPNEMTFSAGVGVPLIPDRLKGIFEIHRVMYDGGTTQPPDLTDAVLGARFALGKSGLVAGAGIRANIDRWVKYGSSPSNVGGLLQLSYAPQPEKVVEAPRVVPSPHVPPPVEPAPAPAPALEPAPAPVVEAPPAPKPETSTTDEILFDSARSRLTNIAKAILDGVALRLKNNLSATCAITGHTDPGEKGDHAALAKARADAAKDYLVKRHGIDAARIQVDGRGDAEAGDDATRNRRAVVTVTFP
ncbi:MAG: OmpA family protein [Thermoanaerobaculia bacterium]|nr:OmpA family protein [Thermoanaerobaculia bacterium]